MQVPRCSTKWPYRSLWMMAMGSAKAIVKRASGIRCFPFTRVREEVHGPDAGGKVSVNPYRCQLLGCGSLGGDLLSSHPASPPHRGRQRMSGSHGGGTPSPAWPDSG